MQVNNLREQHALKSLCNWFKRMRRAMSNEAAHIAYGNYMWIQREYCVESHFHLWE